MNQENIKSFWESHPCGEELVGGVKQNYEAFFTEYDRFRYSQKNNLLKNLDKIEFKDKRVLEIGLGQGADAEQIIRRGGIYSGLDLTPESIKRVQLRFEIRNLKYENLKIGSVLDLPFEDRAFDIVFSYGVLHHVPDIHKAQQEISRVLKPNGRLVLMVYAKWSLNYLVSISLLRRIGMILVYLSGIRLGKKYDEHLANAKREGLWKYLKMQSFIHHNTDGPGNPYSKVYGAKELKKDFSGFSFDHINKEFMHAPPLPVHGLPGAGLLGWALWAHGRKK